MKNIGNIVTFVLLFCLMDLTSFAAQIVKVGGYEFPPFVEIKGEEVSGLALHMLDVMNAYQDKYEFQFVKTSSKRRYMDFENRRYDLILFESIKWGWERYLIDASDVFLTGGEVYITKASPEKDQQYFDSFEGKSIAGFLGYHYGFADFNADESFLKKHFNVTLSTSHASNILTVLEGLSDIAVVPQSYLFRRLSLHPEVKTQLLISSKLDQEYQHTILVRKDSTPTVEEINQLLANMKRDGILDTLWKEYGIKAE